MCIRDREWGASYSQFDWTVGAWEMINHVHPEWVGKTLAFINFELPAYEFDTYTTTYSAPEMFAMLDYFANDYAYSPAMCIRDRVEATQVRASAASAAILAILFMMFSPLSTRFFSSFGMFPFSSENGVIVIPPCKIKKRGRVKRRKR